MIFIRTNHLFKTDLNFIKSTLSTVSIFFLLFTTPICFCEEESDEASPSVSLKWEAIPEASAYQIEFSPLDKTKKKIRFTTKGNTIKTNLLPGKYKFRARSIDTGGIEGEWSDEIEVDVKLLPLLNLKPDNNSLIPAVGTETQPVQFEWNPVSGAQKYRLTVVGQEFKKTIITDQTNFILDLPMGRKYIWEVKVLGTQDIIYKSRDKRFRFAISGKQLLSPQIDEIKSTNVQELSWESIKFAKNYNINIFKRSFLSPRWELLRNFPEHLKNKIILEQPLTPGHYRVEVIAKSLDRPNSLPSKKEFVIKPLFKDLQKLGAPN